MMMVMMMMMIVPLLLVARGLLVTQRRGCWSCQAGRPYLTVGMIMHPSDVVLRAFLPHHQ